MAQTVHKGETKRHSLPVMFSLFSNSPETMGSVAMAVRNRMKRRMVLKFTQRPVEGKRLIWPTSSGRLNRRRLGTLRTTTAVGSAAPWHGKKKKLFRVLFFFLLLGCLFELRIYNKRPKKSLMIGAKRSGLCIWK